MQDYKQLKVWQKSHVFTLRVYELTRMFPKEEMYSLTNQLRRAASSIPANIAEGCGKNSQPDFTRHLNIALGSANEAEYFIILSKDLGYMPVADSEVIIMLINEVKAMLIGLIKKVRLS